MWAQLLTGLSLRGDERVLDLGCGRGAVLLAAAKLVPRGRVVGVDIWRADQTGNCMQSTLANADAEGVADRIELHTRDMTDLHLPNASVDLVVRSLAIHNLPGNDMRRSGRCRGRAGAASGRPPSSSLTSASPADMPPGLRQCGMTGVERRSLGWRAWWGLPLIRTHVVTAAKPMMVG